MDTEKLLLVNKDKKNHLSSSYVPKNLVSLGEIGISVASGRTFELEREAAYALKAMMEDNIKQLNTQVASYEKVALMEIRDSEFEKTPKRSIKRFLYQEK
jgi:hypothetical protein